MRAHRALGLATRYTRPALRARWLATVPRADSDPYPLAGRELGPTYDAGLVETGVADWWERKGYFKPTGSGRSYSLILPPPNVTGHLHLGHALTGSIQDCLVRWRRMCGDRATWVPGTDHAGIATQVVVEKKLQRETGQTRHDLGREGFVDTVWRWKEAYHARITNQLRRMGFSLDWSREYFTLDAAHTATVNRAFVKLFEDGLIYRDTRLVNWCCHLQTAISDIEVDYVEAQAKMNHRLPNGRQVAVGQLHSFAYPVVGLPGQELVVATTRPETMLGDVAVAVHPDDERYQHLHGHYLQHPLTNAHIPVITDSILVDPLKGTGAVKVTPAHDPDDYACGRRHNLPMPNILTTHGEIVEEVAVAAQLKSRGRFEVRKEVLAMLKERGLHRGTGDHPMRVPVCSRSGDILEPLLVPQWFVRCGGLAERARQVVVDGHMQVVPANYGKEWLRWMDGMQDWCISRQLWWGHRIPAYHVTVQGHDEGLWVCAETEAEVSAKVEARLKQLGLAGHDYQVQQDGDVLDTWFSSGLIPLTVTGWPAPGSDQEPSYPLSVLETGGDILFFWVARMVMLGAHLNGRPPFASVLLHPMVRDAQGRKMSKSLGNVIDPLDVVKGTTLHELKKQIEESNLDKAEKKRAAANIDKEYAQGLPACGSDALRFTLCEYMQQGRSINMDISRVVHHYKFCNKLWQMMRFATSNWAANPLTPTPPPLAQARSLEERWIMSRLAHCVVACHETLEGFELGAATQALVGYLRGDLCDVYLEATKLAKGGAGSHLSTLHEAIDGGLRLLHPFMPFLSEALWQTLPLRRDLPESIMVAPYPTPDAYQGWHDARAEEEMDVLLAVVRGVRDFRHMYNLKPHARLQVTACVAEDWLGRLQPHSSLVVGLANTLPVTWAPHTHEAARGELRYVAGPGAVLHIALDSTGIDVQAHTARLDKQMNELQARINKMEAATRAPGYQQKVRADVQQAHASELQGLRDRLAKTMGVAQDLARCAQ